jgi:hypothetical protein
MQGRLRSIDPAAVEAQVVAWAKEALRLSRALEPPELRAVAVDVGKRLDAFRSHFGVLACVCNPGMRARHWAAASAAAGFAVRLRSMGCMRHCVAN